MRRGQRQVEQVKLKMNLQMDDKTFQSSLLETQVRRHDFLYASYVLIPLKGNAHERLVKVAF